MLEYFPVENTGMIMLFSGSHLGLTFKQFIIYRHETSIYLYNDKGLTAFSK